MQPMGFTPPRRSRPDTTDLSQVFTELEARRSARFVVASRLGAGHHIVDGEGKGTGRPVGHPVS